MTRQWSAQVDRSDLWKMAGLFALSVIAVAIVMSNPKERLDPPEIVRARDQKKPPAARVDEQGEQRHSDHGLSPVDHDTPANGADE